MVKDSPSMERAQARSMVITEGGIVASSQTLASQAGAQALARGGSAVDAAIVSNAVLSVVEPMMCGLGGDLFAIHRSASGELTGINASGGAPGVLNLDHVNFSMPNAGIHSVTVPGAVDGWSKLHAKFGKLPWADLFAPAIYYAERGFPVTEIIQYDWQHCERIHEDPNGERLFLPDGRAPRVGETFRNPDLARAFRIVAEAGARSLYEGELADAILRTSRRLSGTLSEGDLLEYSSEWVDPISTTYREWTVYQLPPNGQGVGTLEMLNIMEHFPLPSMDPLSAEAFHIKIEAQKLAFADQRRHIADPRFSAVPLDRMLSKDYAREQAAGISHTIYLAATDREGNTVSWIQSIADVWGSGVVVDGFGFHLHSRGGAFSSDPHHPNALAPRKRPYHTIIPGFMSCGPRHIAFGIMRGMNQAQAQAQFVSYVADHGMNIQAALEAPRFSKITLGGSDVRIESRVPADVRAELEKRGHALEVRGDYSGYMGGGQAVLRDATAKINYGASSPRKDGAAIPEPEPYWSSPMYFQQFYLTCLSHASYMIGSEGIACVVDPQRDVSLYLDEARAQNLEIRYIVETHLHADFVSGHQELAARTGAMIYLGANAGATFPHHPVHDGDEIRFGRTILRFLETPGHTIESISVTVTDLDRGEKPFAVLTGDTLFIGDVGRPDLAPDLTPQQLAGLLFDSLHQKLIPLGDDVEVWPAHGAGSLCGKQMRPERQSTIGKELALNYALRPRTKEEFVRLLTADLPERPAYFARDAEINRTGAAALTDLPPLPLLSTEQVLATRDGGAIVLDTRPSQQFCGGHVPGAVHVALSGQYASWAATLVGLDQPIVLVAEDEAQLEESRTRLARVGIDRVSGGLKNGMAGWTGPVAQIAQLTVEELRRESPDVQIVDVRRRPEWDEGHIEGAILIPLHQLSKSLGALDRTRPVAVHCKGGYRSAIAASLVQRAGFENVANVVGGFDAWRACGLPEVRETVVPA